MKGADRCIAGRVVVVAMGCFEEPAPWVPGDEGLGAQKDVPRQLQPDRDVHGIFLAGGYR